MQLQFAQNVHIVLQKTTTNEYTIFFCVIYNFLKFKIEMKTEQSF